MSETLFGQVSGLARVSAPRSVGAHPLVVAIHGGTYTSRYFDVPGYSLMERAEANAIPIIAIDRPMYGRTPAIPGGKAGIAAQAAYLRDALPAAWAKFGAGCSGVVLVGHSIGAAIAALVAGDPGDRG